MKNSYSILISGIDDEVKLGRTLWSIQQTAPDRLLDVVVISNRRLPIIDRFVSVMNIRRGEIGAATGDFWVGICGTPILTEGCLEQLIDECSPEQSTGASIYRLPSDDLLSLDAFGTNLRNGHVKKAILNPVYTPEYQGMDPTNVTATHRDWNPSPAINYRILPNAIALSQESATCS